MKKKFLPALLVMAALCLAPSCSDDEDEVLRDDLYSETDNTGESNPDENNPDEDEPDDEDIPDDGNSDEENPLVNDRIVLEGEDFTGYLPADKLYPDDSIFSEETQHEETSLPDAVLGEHSGYALAWLRSDAADYQRAEYPATLTISKTDNNRYQFKAEAYRWALDYDSENWVGDAKDNVPDMTITANPDNSVYYFNNGSNDSYYTETQLPNWGADSYNGEFDKYTYEDVTGGWRVTGFDGKISSDGTKYEFLVWLYNIASGTNFIFRSGEPSPAEAMAGHYHGTLVFDNKWLSGVATELGGTFNNYNDRPDLYALIKPDPDTGELRLEIMGFDIGRNEFGNLIFTGITDAISRTNWAYDFALDNFEIQVPINDVWGTVTGSLEGEMSANGELMVVINAVFPVIGDVTIVFTGEYADWLNWGWNTYYGNQSNRPW